MNKTILPITEKNFIRYFNIIKKVINPDDVIAIQGGGNLGNQYIDQERIRSKVIKKFKNKIVIMPSTFHLIDENKNITAYSIKYSMDNITIILREHISYKKVVSNFKCNAALTPDIVLSLPKYVSNNSRDGVGLCLRNDIESKISSDEKKYIKDILYQTYNNLYIFDTCIKQGVEYENQEKMLFSVLNEISKYELVITDKLHSMIFCFLTNTPCIVLSNYNHKIEGVYSWIKDCPWIKLIKNIDDISNYVQCVIDNKNTNYIIQATSFENLKNIFKENY